MLWTFSSSDAKRATRAREQFVTALKLRGETDADYSACETIFGELIGNVVRHAPGRIRVVLDWSCDEAVLCVEDHGPPFHFNPSLPINPLAENGRGLFLVSALAEHIDVEEIVDNGKSVRVVLPIRPRTAAMQHT